VSRLGGRGPTRRLFIALALMTLTPGLALADWQPSRPIRIIVPYAAGGGADLITRRVAEAASPDLGQPIIVENRPGAGTAIGAVAVARAPADGYTLLLATSTTLCVNPVIRKDLPYRTADFTPVASLQALPFMLSASKHLPVGSLKELVAQAKARKGELNYGTLGIGSSNHVLGGLLSRAAGIEIEPVHYQSGAPALIALMRGDIHLYFDGISTSIPRVANGDYTGLAVTSRQRVKAAPDIPTVFEEGLGDVGLSVWYGLVAPGGTPPEVVTRLNRAFNDVLRRPEIASTMQAEGTEPMPLSPAEFAQVIAEDTRAWGDAIRSLNLPLN
jgi:tripartite-type tricarboxylate transporter receptor subunit TctC